MLSQLPWTNENVKSLLFELLNEAISDFAVAPKSKVLLPVESPVVESSTYWLPSKISVHTSELEAVLGLLVTAKTSSPFGEETELTVNWIFALEITNPEVGREEISLCTVYTWHLPPVFSERKIPWLFVSAPATLLVAQLDWPWLKSE